MSEKPKRTIANAIYDETRANREEVKKLQPLLDLLKTVDPEREGPIEQIQQSLEAILLGQRHLLLMMEDMDKRIMSMSKNQLDSA